MNELVSQGGSTQVFIAQWDARAPLDQTDLIKAEMTSRRWWRKLPEGVAKTLTLGRRPGPWWGQPAPPGGR